VYQRRTAFRLRAATGDTIEIVRKLVTWALVTLGIAALVRRLRRRRGAAEAEAPAADPAAELRRKLDETRATEPEPAAEPVTASVDERRAEVHDQGRAALDEMREPAES
jgi:hypothetical protein